MELGTAACRPVITARAEDDIKIAAKRMREDRVGSLVIVDECRKPVGILTDRDLAMTLAEDPGTTNQTVADCMTPAPHCLPPDATILEAAHLVRRKLVRRIPIVDEEGRLVAIASSSSILANLASNLGALSQAELSATLSPPAQPARTSRLGHE